MNRVYFVIPIVLLISCSCGKASKNQLDTRNSQFASYYGIYLISDTDSIPREKIIELSQKLIPGFKIVDTISESAMTKEISITLFENPKVNFTPPDLDYLSHSNRRLSQNEMQELQDPKRAVLLSFSGINRNVTNDHIGINKLIDTLITNNKAIVTDYVTVESFNRLSWKGIRCDGFNFDNNNITSQITIHLYRDGGFCRAVTLGMGKFCLPDISIENLSCKNQNSYGSLINLICQTLLENPFIKGDSTIEVNIDKIKNNELRNQLLSHLENGSKKYGTIRLKEVEPQEGDDYNSQFQLVFNNRDFSSPQEEQQKLISQIFGASDEIKYIKHDQQLLETSQKAKKELPKLKAKYNNGLEPGYSILLKAPFETDNGGNEWMWIEVSQWNDEEIRGILQNDPFEISDLKAGAIVSVMQKDIFDYILNKPDGSFEGNETGKLIGQGE